MTARSIGLLPAFTLMVITDVRAQPATRPAVAVKVEHTVAEQSSEVSIVAYLIDGRAVQFESGPDSPVARVFDLENPGWQSAAAKPVTRAEAEAWADEGCERALAGMAKSGNPKQIEFGNAMLRPDLKVVDADGLLTFSNSIVTQKVTPGNELDAATLRHLLTYLELAEYQRQMEAKHLPPMLAIAVLKELGKRNAWSAAAELTIQTPGPKIEQKHTTALTALSEAEAADVQKALARR